jgi:hypothetical protein
MSHVIYQASQSRIDDLLRDAGHSRLVREAGQRADASLSPMLRDSQHRMGRLRRLLHGSDQHSRHVDWESMTPVRALLFDGVSRPPASASGPPPAWLTSTGRDGCATVRPRTTQADRLLVTVSSWVPVQARRGCWRVFGGVSRFQ